MANKSGTLRLIVQGANDELVGFVAVIERIENNPGKLAAMIAKITSQPYAYENGQPLFLTVVKHGTVADLPLSRPGQSDKFRDAWRWDGTKIEPDLVLCRAQLMAEVRAERDQRLAATDVVMTRSMERGQPDQALKGHRQALRDLPSAVQAQIGAIDNAVDLETHTVDWPTKP